MHDYHRTEQTVQTDIPTVQPIYITSGGTAIIVLAMLFLTIIILYVTSRNAASAPYGIVGAVVFFMLGTPFGILAVNGGLAQMWGDYHRERTIQLRDRDQITYSYHVLSARIVDPPQLTHTPPTQGLQPLALSAASNYVPANPGGRNVAYDAQLWAAGLYIKDQDDPNVGQPNPDRVNMDAKKEPPGRLGRGGAPTDSQIKEFLLAKKFLVRINGGIALNLKDYPNLDSIRWLTR